MGHHVIPRTSSTHANDPPEKPLGEDQDAFSQKVICLDFNEPKL